MQKSYRLEDFLENDQFLEWFRFPNADNSTYWKRWLEENPLARQAFEAAVAAMVVIEGSQPDLSDIYIRGKVRGIIENMGEPENKRGSSFSRFGPLLRWAAIILLGAGLSWILLDRGSGMVSDNISLSDQHKGVTVESFVNNSELPLLINLPDGSSVLLGSGSKLEYDSSPKGIRKVYLSGEGFFEVAKDSTTPFFVYTSHLITRVLGTSFLVRSIKEELRATVSVRSGEVSVIRRHQDNKIGAGIDSVLLKSDEQVSFDVGTKELNGGTWESERANILPEQLHLSNFEFYLTPITEVFRMLEEAYGVTIEYDAEAFKNCTITATFSDEPFLDKIRMICIGIEANFTISGNHIKIFGDGCENR